MPTPLDAFEAGEPDPNSKLQPLRPPPPEPALVPVLVLVWRLSRRRRRGGSRRSLGASRMVFLNLRSADKPRKLLRRPSGRKSEFQFQWTIEKCRRRRRHWRQMDADCERDEASLKNRRPTPRGCGGRASRMTDPAGAASVPSAPPPAPSPGSSRRGRHLLRTS